MGAAAAYKPQSAQLGTALLAVPALRRVVCRLTCALHSVEYLSHSYPRSQPLARQPCSSVLGGAADFSGGGTQSSPTFRGWVAAKLSTCLRLAQRGVLVTFEALLAPGLEAALQTGTRVPSVEPCAAACHAGNAVCVHSERRWRRAQGRSTGSTGPPTRLPLSACRPHRRFASRAGLVTHITLLAAVCQASLQIDGYAGRHEHWAAAILHHRSTSPGWLADVPGPRTAQTTGRTCSRSDSHPSGSL